MHFCFVSLVFLGNVFCVFYFKHIFFNFLRVGITVSSHSISLFQKESKMVCSG